MGAATAPAITTTPTLAAGLTFASQTVNSTSAAQTVTVRNTGNGPLTFSSLSVVGTDFAISANTCLAAPVAPNGTCTINVTFTPTVAGTRSATLRLADNAAGSPQSLPLTGTGAAPPAAATFIFGNQSVETKPDSNTAGRAEAFKTVSGSSGTVTQLRIFVDTGSTGPLVAALYTNTATNHPGTLMVSGTLAAPVAGSFNTVNVTGPTSTVTAGSTYWIAVLGTTGTFRFRDRAGVGAGSSETSASATLSAMPTTWATGASFTDGAISGYAAGTVTSSPPPPPAGLAVLLGNAATETHVDNNTAGRAEAFKTTVTTAGTVQQLRIFIDATSTGTNLKIGLYNNVAGHPGTLLTSGTIAAPVVNANNAVAVSTPVAVTVGQTYWIAVLAPTGTVRFRDRALVGAGNSETSSSGVLTNLPNTWTTGTVFTDGLLSAVALG